MSESAPNTPTQPDEGPHTNLSERGIGALLARLNALEKKRGAEPTTDRGMTRAIWTVMTILGLVIVGLVAWNVVISTRCNKLSSDLAVTRAALTIVSGGNFVRLRAHLIELVDTEGDHPIVVLAQNEAGAGMVQTTNAKGDALVTLAGTKEGEGVVVTSNGRGQDLVMLGVTKDGDGTVTTKNGMGLNLVRLGVTEGGGGTVVTTNRKGLDSVTLGGLEGGGGAVSIKDGEGRDVVVLGISTNGGGTIRTMNANGHELVSVGVSTNGKGMVAAFDPSGTFGRALLTPGP